MIATIFLVFAWISAYHMGRFVAHTWKTNEALNGWQTVIAYVVLIAAFVAVHLLLNASNSYSNLVMTAFCFLAAVL